jgi:hypothetical protein
MPRLRDRLSAAHAAWRTSRRPWTAPSAARSRATGGGRGRRLHAAPPPPPPAGRAATARDLVLTLFQGVTALTAVAAVLYTARSLDYTADATNATRVQVQLAERGQITERFGRAIDQLGQEGPDKLSIRLGGIYALEHVMRDSAPDAATVVEVLCAFVRTHAPRPSKPPQRVPPSPPDVQAAVVVLARRPDITHELELAGTLLSLPDANLAEGNLAEANLVGANLADTDLSFANLLNANLVGANLTGANLASAHLLGANLAGANLAGAAVWFADLSAADLTGANLTGVNLFDADLSFADLAGANLASADLSGVSGLTSAQLVGARVNDWTRLPAGVVVPSPTPTR